MSASPNPALERFLRGIPLFSLLEPADMLDLLRLLRPVTLEAGQALFRQGDPGNAMWVLGEGTEVSISATPREGGRPAVVAYSRAGATVGEMALVDDGPRSGTAVVIQGGSAHEIDAVDFQVLRDGRSPAAYKVLRRICMDLCARLRATTDRIVPSSNQVLDAPDVPDSRRADVAIIDEFAPFRGLPEVVKLALAQKLTVVTVDTVLPIFGEGEPADAAWFVVEGEVTVGRNGKTLSVLGPGSMFGLIACIDQGRRSASCVATGPARLLRLRDADFDALFASGNRFAYELVDLVARQLVRHLRDANELIPRPGALRSPGVAAGMASRVDAALEELPDEAILPLELELELDA